MLATSFIDVEAPAEAASIRFLSCASPEAMMSYIRENMCNCATQIMDQQVGKKWVRGIQKQ